MMSILLAVITIGFTHTDYSVNECEGLAHVTIKVINQSLGVLQRDITVLLSIKDSTAFGKVFIQRYIKSNTLLLLL